MVDPNEMLLILSEALKNNTGIKNVKLPDGTQIDYDHDQALKAYLFWKKIANKQKTRFRPFNMNSGW